jgi:hypothetical protein
MASIGGLHEFGGFSGRRLFFRHENHMVYGALEKVVVVPEPASTIGFYRRFQGFSLSKYT